MLQCQRLLFARRCKKAMILLGTSPYRRAVHAHAAARRILLRNTPMLHHTHAVCNVATKNRMTRHFPGFSAAKQAPSSTARLAVAQRLRAQLSKHSSVPCDPPGNEYIKGISIDDTSLIGCATFSSFTSSGSEPLLTKLQFMQWLMSFVF